MSLRCPQKGRVMVHRSELAPSSGGHRLRLLGSGLCSAFLSWGHLESVSSHLSVHLRSSVDRPALPTFLVWWCWLAVLQLWVGFGHQLFTLLSPAATHLCISSVYKETLAFVFSSFGRGVA
ncbi:hypothetical protein mRhiFer1_010118 [Rhinolophus ferrumequinum]|uniref:Uncharacterized protein n=1 Tax=Rhinolophus ferrumequinum TaxID=59479 RepID=A0A7J7XQR2_RHIFE|nr:hypothetical protein mRhiFer1_010118 [Rhinolophus ferrumequinum]